MDDPAMTTSAAPVHVTEAPCHAAATMVRVHEQLRRGAAPSFEALLAFGVPTVGRRVAA